MAKKKNLPVRSEDVDELCRVCWINRQQRARRGTELAARFDRQVYDSRGVFLEKIGSGEEGRKEL